MRIFSFLMALLTLIGMSQSAWADFALILPDRISVDEQWKSPQKKSVKTPPSMVLTIHLITLEPFTGKASALHLPQSFTALRFHDETNDRTEHLSILKEIMLYGEQGYQAEVALPVPGVYHFILQTKAIWQADRDRFIQHVSKLQIPAFGSSEGWDKAADLPFEIVPMTRPSGLYAGMSFTGQVLYEGKPVPNAMIEASWLNTAIKADIHPMPTPEEMARFASQASPATKKQHLVASPLPWQAVQEIKADSQGIFTFTCPQSGWWVFATTRPSNNPLQDPSGKLKELDIKTAFWVFFEQSKKR